MSEVKRYARYGDLVEATEGLLKLYPMMSVYVLAEDFDRVTAERDALQARLTAADERVDSAITFVARLIESAGGQPSIATGYLRDILDALKPAKLTSEEHVCNGCGAKGWTANCKECVPY